MYKNLRWKLLSIVAVAAIMIVAFYPPSKRIHLGLDLQGGVNFVLQVNTDDALRIETQETSAQLHEALSKAGLATPTVKVSAPTTFEVDGVSQDQDQQFRQISSDQAGVDYDRTPGVNGAYTFTMKTNIAATRRQEAVTQEVQTIERRVNELGVSEPIVAPYGSAGQDIIVQLPGMSDVGRAKDIIGTTAVLELKLVQAGPSPDKTTLLQASSGQVPAGTEVLPGAPSSTAQGQPDASATSEWYLVSSAPVVTGRDISSAREQPDQYNLPSVGFSVKSQGATRLQGATSANIGRGLAIILDGRVISAPTVQGVISSEGEITGHFSMQEAQDLALVLKSGALPASVTYLQQEVVGPTLGSDSVREGVMASLISLVFVAGFMLFYYRLAGINAIVSIVLNLVILLGFMAYLGAVMTLPGIAGFILTIGMGVDSNVLIFERIREELDRNKGVRQAVAAGFDRVFITILDTHISSMISAAFLFQFGTGPIRGFATTLFFGLISNIFTSVFVSRALFELVLSRKPAGATKLSI